MTEETTTVVADIPVEALLYVALAVVGLSALSFAVAAWRGRGPQDTLFLVCLRQLTVLYLRVWHGARKAPQDPMPPTGAALLVANHRSGLDPTLLAAQTRRLVRFLMAREYYELWWLRWIFGILGEIPVNRDGNDLAATKQALKALRSGEIVGIFPQGGIRWESAEAEILEGDEQSFKHGAALLALKTGVPVYTAYIAGTPPKDSVLASYLTPSRSRVVFSGPIDLGGGGDGRRRSPSKEELQEATRSIVRHISELKEQFEGRAAEAAEMASREPAV